MPWSERNFAVDGLDIYDPFRGHPGLRTRLQIARWSPQDSVAPRVLLFDLHYAEEILSI